MQARPRAAVEGEQMKPDEAIAEAMAVIKENTEGEIGMTPFEGLLAVARACGAVSCSFDPIDGSLVLGMPGTVDYVTTTVRVSP